MAGKVKGITIEIGGETTKLTKALGEMKKETNAAQNELKQVERLLKLDPKNTVLLTQKQEVLAKQIDGVKNTLQTLKKTQADVEKDMKNGVEVNAEEYRRLQREILETEHKLEDLEKETNKFTKAGNNLSSVGNKMSEVGQKGMALTGVLTGVGAALVANTNETREYREDMARLESAFEVTGKSADAAKEIYKDFFVVLGESDRSVEAVNHLAKLTDSQEELAKWTDICAGVSATFGDSLPIEGLTEAANETAKVGKVTGPLADALNWAGINEDLFNKALEKCNNEQERSSLITSTLGDAYQSAADQFRITNAEVIANREAQQDLNDELAELGALIEPILTSITSKVAEILKWFNGLDDGQKKFIGTTGAVAAAIPPLLILGGNLIDSLGKISKAFGSTSTAGTMMKGVFTSLKGVLTSHPLLTGAALVVGFAYACDESAQKVVALAKETSQLSKETDELIESSNNAEASIAAESGEINRLIDELYSLEGQENKTTEETENMKSIINQLNNMIPDLKLNLDAETGSLNLQRGVVQGLANDYINLAYAKAYEQELQGLVTQKIKLEKKREELNDEMVDVGQDIQNSPSTLWSLGKIVVGAFTYESNKSASEALDKEIADVSKKMAEYENLLNKTETSDNEPPPLNYGKVPSSGAGGAKATKMAENQSEKAFEKEYASLKNRLSLQLITNAEYYKGLDLLRTKYFEKGSEEYEKYELEIKQGYREQDFQNLKHMLDMGYINEKEYYSELAKLRDSYYAQGSEQWINATLEIQNHLNNTMDDIASKYKEKLSEIESNQLDFAKKIKDSVSVVDSASMNGKTGYSLHNWKNDVQNLKDYKKSLVEIEDILTPLLGDRYDDFFNTVLSGSQTETRVVAYELSHMSKTQLQDWVDSWEEYQQIAEDTAEDVYAEEINMIKNGYFDEIISTAEGMSAEFEAVGKTVADYFGKGFINEFSALISGVKNSLENSLIGEKLSSILDTVQERHQGGSIVYNTEINQNIGTATPRTAYEGAQETRRVMENLTNEAVLS